MSLVKKPEMTEKKVAANRRNQNLCNAPLTEERRECSRAAPRVLVTTCRRRNR